MIKFSLFSIKYCLKNARINAEDIAYVVFYEKPFLKFERLLETYLAFAPKGFKSFSKAMPAWIKDKLFQKSSLLKQLNQISSSSQINWKQKLLFSEHHLSHAASAFYPSPFRNAAILTLDGVGEWTTSSIAVGSGKDIKIIKEITFLTQSDYCTQLLLIILVLKLILVNIKLWDWLHMETKIRSSYY